MSLSRKYLQITLPLILAGALLVGILQWYGYDSQKTRVVQAIAAQEARRVASLCRRIVEATQESLQSASSAFRVAGSEIASDFKRLEALGIEAAAVTDRGGRTIWSMRFDQEGQKGMSPVFRRAVIAAIKADGPLLFVAENGVAVAATRPIDGGYKLTLIRRYDPATLIGSKTVLKKGRPPGELAALNGLTGWRFGFQESDGRIRVDAVALSPVALEPFYFETVVPAGEALRALWTGAFLQFAGALALIGAAFVLLYLLAFRPFVGRMGLLAKAIYDLRDGNEETLPTFAERELAGLVEAIRLAARAIRQHQEMLDWILENVPAGILIYHEKILYANRHARETLGYDKERLLQMSPMDLIGDETDPAERVVLLESVRRRLAGEKGITSREILVKTARGSVPMYGLGDAIVLDGRPCGIVTFIDLSEIRRIESELQLITDHLPMFAYHVAGEPGKQRYLYISSAIEKMTGYTVGEVLKNPHWWIEHVHPDDRAAVIARQGRLERKGHLRHRYRLLKKGGGYLWVEDTVVRLSHVKEREIVGFHRDATREMIWRFAHTALAEANERMVYAESEERLWQDICTVLVQSGFCRYAWVGRPNERRGRLEPQCHFPEENRCVHGVVYPLEGPAHEGTPFAAEAAREEGWSMVVCHDVDQSQKHETLRQKLLQNGFHSAVSIRVELDDGYRVLTLYADLPGWFDASSRRLLASLAKNIAFAVDDLRKRRRLHRLGYYHPKSDLPNENALTRALDGLGGEVVLAMINLYNFSLINLNFGFAVGDKVLLEAARLLGAGLEKGVGLYHLGGDKFALLARHGDVERLERLVRRLQRRLFGQIRAEGVAVPLFMQVGLAGGDGSGDGKRLKEQAMSALSFCKGPSDVVRYEGWMAKRTRERIHLVRYLKETIEKRAFRFYYQPVVRAGDHLPVKCEALLRLEGPDKEPMSSELVVSVAEELGLVGAVNRLAIEGVFADIAQWTKEGIETDVALNISAHDIADRDFIPFLKEALRRYGVDAKRVILEITERVAVRSGKEAIAFVKRVKELGFTVAIDDFGVAHSALHEIARIDFDILKIDGLFIEAIGEGRRNEEVVRFIIGLAHAMGAVTVAERVERIGQVRWLEANGVDFLQGYFFAEAMEAQTFKAWYNARKNS